MENREIEAHNYKILQECFDIKEDENLYILNKKQDVKINEETYKNILESLNKDPNKILKSIFDPSWLLYIDTAALYSGIMTLYMPYKIIKYENYSLELLNKILKTKTILKLGYFIEVDLEYPDCIKEKTKYYPLAPIKRKVKYVELLDWQKERKLNKKSSTEKLICDTGNKEKYLCHYQNLQFYIKMGMKITQVHSIISFKQKCFMKEIIQ